ncbi:MAG: intracellular protease, PfpI family [Acidobacteria bacterium]|nr:intracellular protease, PfpI family [Acidobacteriota bacterium]
MATNAGTNLAGKLIAILVTDGFEQIELTDPKEALEHAGAITHIVAPDSGKVQGWNHDDKADKFTVDVTLDETKDHSYDALVLPGGVRNPDVLRTIPAAVEFIKSFSGNGKPIAAICHGPWTLIEADAVRGRTMTSWPSLKTDLRNAGARWVDEEVVVDDGLVTSRKPDDLPEFNRKMIELFASGWQPKARAAG